MTTTVETVTSVPEAEPVPDQLRRDHDEDQVDELPPSLQRAATSFTPSENHAQRKRHSKKLSLNFPILVPFPQESPRPTNGSFSSWSPSPTVASPYTINTPRSGIPFPSPDELKDGFNLADGPDFLTLIAGQERKVMELKEELSKAESALVGLKKQWALFEAKKKQSELRNKTVRLGPVSSQTTSPLGEDEELERARRKEIREQKMREFGMTEGELGRSDSTGGRRNGGRVFAGRHTRTLSLLQNNKVPEPAHTANRPKSRTEGGQADKQQAKTAASKLASTEQADQEERRQTRQSLARQATLQELIANSATGAAQMNFGKTYKDLAHASRKSLPPGTDEIVKQGKQVYDGVSQGFWNFVEDIRQATVGDEAVNGTHVEQRKEVKKPKSTKKLGEHEKCERHGSVRNGESKNHPSNGDDHKPDKDNFWKEFGLETPNNTKPAGANTSRKASGTKGKDNHAPSKDHESKSSTDSQCPPSLLADLMDVNEDDESWDNWPVESPVSSRSNRQRERAVEIRRASESTDEDSITKISPSSRQKFTRKGHMSAETSWMDLTT